MRLVTGRYFQDWLLLDTDWNRRLEPNRGGALRAVGDIGSHWLDLLAFITGQRITSVMADLATFIPTLRQPSGSGRDLLHRAGDRDARARDRDGGRRHHPAALRERRARSVAISQLSPGRKNSLQYEVDGSAAAAFWDSEQPDQMWIGHRERANEILIRNPALMDPAGQAAAALPGGHVEGFADTFRALFRAIYADVGAGAPSERPSYPTSPTAMTRCS